MSSQLLSRQNKRGGGGKGKKNGSTKDSQCQIVDCGQSTGLKEGLDLKTQTMKCFY